VFFTGQVPLVTGELAEKFLLVHPVLEGLAPVDEDDGNLVIVEAAKLGIAVDIDLAPIKPAALVQLAQAFFDDLAEMTSSAGIHHNLARLRHGWEV